MAKISAEERAAHFAGFLAGYLKIDINKVVEVEPYIIDLLKHQDKATRHACAEAVSGNEAHSRCINCCGGLVKTE